MFVWSTLISSGNFCPTGKKRFFSRKPAEPPPILVEEATGGEVGEGGFAENVDDDVSAQV
jgi:hypothetical protein